jgi:SAM-dependent methyltransferase
LEQVGPKGYVVATDLETRFLEAIETDNLEVRRHNIVSDPLEKHTFDLIHVRAVLAHLPERDDVLRRLVAALKPGGWLVPIVADFTSVCAVDGSDDDRAFFDRAFASFLETARVIGFDPTYGRRIGSHLRSIGLREVHVEGTIMEWDALHPLASLYQMTLQRLHDLITGMGALSEDEYLRLNNIMTTSGFRGLSNTIFLARGRRVR